MCNVIPHSGKFLRDPIFAVQKLDPRNIYNSVQCIHGHDCMRRICKNRETGENWTLQKFPTIQYAIFFFNLVVLGVLINQ